MILRKLTLPVKLLERRMQKRKESRMVLEKTERCPRLLSRSNRRKTQRKLRRLVVPLLLLLLLLLPKQQVQRRRLRRRKLTIQNNQVLPLCN